MKTWANKILYENESEFLEIKNMTTEIQNATDRLNWKLDRAEEKISKLKDKSEDSILYSTGIDNTKERLINIAQEGLICDWLNVHKKIIEIMRES